MESRHRHTLVQREGIFRLGRLVADRVPLHLQVRQRSIRVERHSESERVGVACSVLRLHGNPCLHGL